MGRVWRCLGRDCDFTFVVTFFAPLSSFHVLESCESELPSIYPQVNGHGLNDDSRGCTKLQEGPLCPLFWVPVTAYNTVILRGLYWGYTRVMLGLYWGYIRVMLRLYEGYVEVILGLY